MQQEALFEDLAPSPGALPEGLETQAEFLSREEEGTLIEVIRELPLQEAKYKEYTARRRVVSYGGKFDYDSKELLPSSELIEALQPLRVRVAAWAGTKPEELVHALVAEYSPGTPLGWHRDVLAELRERFWCVAGKRSRPEVSALSAGPTEEGGCPAKRSPRMATTLT